MNLPTHFIKVSKSRGLRTLVNFMGVNKANLEVIIHVVDLMMAILSKALVAICNSAV